MEAKLESPNSHSYHDENNDRVFRIQRGTAVEYAVFDDDTARVKTGSEIELLISSIRVRPGS